MTALLKVLHHPIIDVCHKRGMAKAPAAIQEDINACQCRALSNLAHIITPCCRPAWSKAAWTAAGWALLHCSNCDG